MLQARFPASDWRLVPVPTNDAQCFPKSAKYIIESFANKLSGISVRTKKFYIKIRLYLAF